MALEPEELRSRLADLHRQLQNTHSVSGDVRELLVEVLSDIDRLLSGAARPQTASEQLASGLAAGESSAAAQPSGGPAESNRLSRRLGDAAQQFEETHPQLAANIGSVVTALSRLGI